MSIPLLVREMLAEERSMVLSDWKKGLWDDRPGWGKSLHSDEWWALINHVIDRITLPSCAVYMACHRNEVSVPLAWAASRNNSIVRLYCPARLVQKEPELAAFLERNLRNYATAADHEFNPFLELKRT